MAQLQRPPSSNNNYTAVVCDKEPADKDGVADHHDNTAVTQDVFRVDLLFGIVLKHP